MSLCFDILTKIFQPLNTYNFNIHIFKFLANVCCADVIFSTPEILGDSAEG